ncbi:hypothetical protein [Xiashengella succiniciproducens]|jgi:hypothetical protein|uniref:Uncharacterized protein n=1 Tax=Xiashengella succiniciproducens TaxID=2949635 RepID=A0A9J6ZLF3_9BACT|nr:hypothetical protein [Alkaliflexus sp. Ai-910]MDI9537908.1 hypothetical protein [Bacteroidota bacterium]URW78553.1 hypothetical protein M9189_06710 [Alkaliflexus sp. Ai-910]HHU00913.1 hypothetical protein [Bacteroidales bacterium]
MSNRFPILKLLVIIFLILPAGLNSQEDTIIGDCLTEFGPTYVVGDKTAKALLIGEEVAEFRTTLFDGNTYRIVMCSHTPGLVEFSLYDTNRNLLFRNSDYGTPGSWDFKVEGSMECIIEARLNNEIAESGIAIMLLGFKTR